MSQIWFFPPDELTFEADELNEESRWSYYVTSYGMLDKTEGIPWTRVQRSTIQRNVPADSLDDPTRVLEDGPIITRGNFDIRVVPENYKLNFHGTEYILRPTRYYKPEKRALAKAGEPLEESKVEMSQARFEDHFVRNNAWMKGQSGEDVDRTKTRYQKWIKDGPPAEDTAMEDVEMAGA